MSLIITLITQVASSGFQPQMAHVCYRIPSLRMFPFLLCRGLTLPGTREGGLGISNVELVVEMPSGLLIDILTLLSALTVSPSLPLELWPADVLWHCQKTPATELDWG